jgi:hypothetical protein
MLIKLLPEQIVKIWDYIRAGILSTPTPMMDLTPDAIRNILRSLLIGELQCWAIVSDNEVYGYVLTNIAEDHISKSRFLNIYDVYAFKHMDKEMMTTAFSALNEFAKGNNCSRIGAYSNINKLIGIAKEFGFTTDAQFLTRKVI